jgi:hypothetical protein
MMSVSQTRRECTTLLSGALGRLTITLDIADAPPVSTLQVQPLHMSHVAYIRGCRKRLEQAEVATDGKLTEELRQEFAALEEHGSTSEEVCCC